MNVYDYFTYCEKEMPEKVTPLRRTSFALRRSGVNTMAQLCEIRTQAPDKLAYVRDIGKQSLAIIDEVISLYEIKEMGGQQTNNDI